MDRFFEHFSIAGSGKESVSIDDIQHSRRHHRNRQEKVGLKIKLQYLFVWRKWFMFIFNRYTFARNHDAPPKGQAENLRTVFIAVAHFCRHFPQQFE